MANMTNPATKKVDMRDHKLIPNGDYTHGHPGLPPKQPPQQGQRTEYPKGGR